MPPKNANQQYLGARPPPARVCAERFHHARNAAGGGPVAGRAGCTNLFLTWEGEWRPAIYGRARGPGLTIRWVGSTALRPGAGDGTERGPLLDGLASRPKPGMSRSWPELTGTLAPKRGSSKEIPGSAGAPGRRGPSAGGAERPAALHLIGGAPFADQVWEALLGPVPWAM